MAFKASRDISGRDIKYGLMDNSEALEVGEAIIPGIQGDTSVVKTAGSTTGGILGVVIGIVGLGATGGRVQEVSSYTAESDNITDKLVKIAYIPAYIPMEWEVDLDAAAETTDNSGGFGNFAVDSNGTKLSESSYVGFGTVASKQFFSFGLVDSGASSTLVAVRCINPITV